MSHHILVCDLGFGDAGKGSITDALVRRDGTKLVVRFSGGPNAAHNVVAGDIHHTFSQFGSGTLAGTLTLLTKHVLVDPARLINEAVVLADKGVSQPLTKLYVHEDCLVITPFHEALNKLRELARKERHGSCGVGLGETVKHAEGGNGLRVKDLLQWSMKGKLEQIRADLEGEADTLAGFPHQNRSIVTKHDVEVAEALSAFESVDLLDALCWRYYQFAHSVNVVDDTSVAHLLKRNDSVFEGSQGVLLDQDWGFHPFTTWSSVTLKNAIELCKAVGVEYETLGVMRAYSCRHGPGPFPTEAKLELPERHNWHNEWQGSFRWGWLDLELLRYALTVCPVHALAVTHCDVLDSRPAWQVATGYKSNWTEPVDPTAFPAREKQTAALMKAKPVYHNVPSWGVLGEIASHLKLPVKVKSFGARAVDKVFA